MSLKYDPLLISVTQVPTPGGEASADDPFALTLSFADGGVFVARRASRDGALRAALSLPDGLHITVDEAGVVWQSRPDTLGGLAWAPAEGALAGGAERGGAVALRSLAVLEDGSVATRWADGAAEALMKDGSAGFFGGRARGWEWTNSKGLRQVASPPQDSGFRVQGSGFRVQGSGFRVPSSHEPRVTEPCLVRTGPAGLVPGKRRTKLPDLSGWLTGLQATCGRR